MAGSKNWADDEVARAVDVNTYLATQVVITATSFGTAWLGKHVYRSDWDMTFVYDGTSWVSYPRGLITRDTLTGTGTGGYIAASRVTANNSELTYTPVTGERYAYEIELSIKGYVALDTFSIYTQLNAGSGYSDYGIQREVDIVKVGKHYQTMIRCINLAASGAVHKWRVQVIRESGTGTCEVMPESDCSVTHIGQG